MLACANTSFVANVEQISCMVIVNNDTYLVNQKMKSYFVEFFFHQKFVSFMTIVEHNLSNMTSSKILIIIVICD
jgi:hypothetical protein